MTYFLTAVVAIIDPVLDQVEVHLRGDDTPVVWRDLNRHTFHEAVDVFSLFLKDILERVDEFGFLIGDENVHVFGDGFDLVGASELDVPEADALTVVFAHVWGGKLVGTSWPMLRHLSDSTKTTAAWVSVNTLDVAPQRRRVEWWLYWTTCINNSHCAHRIVLFQENFESLVNNACF